MSERNTISRHTGYTAIPNAIMRDETLSMDARGFLALIMGMKEGWVFRQSNMLKLTGWGRDKYRKILRELQDRGHLEIVPQNGDDGRFTGNQWIIHDEPMTQDVDTEGLKTRLPVTEGLKNRLPVLPAGGKIRPFKKTNLKKKTNNKNPPYPPRGAGSRKFGLSEGLKKRLKDEYDI